MSLPSNLPVLPSSAWSAPSFQIDEAQETTSVWPTRGAPPLHAPPLNTPSLNPSLNTLNTLTLSCMHVHTVVRLQSHVALLYIQLSGCKATFRIYIRIYLSNLPSELAIHIYIRNYHRCPAAKPVAIVFCEYIKHFKYFESSQSRSGRNACS